MSRILISLASVSGCAAYTSFNSPTAPGNWNLPSEKPVFGADIVKNLPDINVRYHFPHVDAATILSETQDEISLAKRIGAASSELKFDESVMHSLPASFLRGPEGELYAALSGTNVESVAGDNQDAMRALMLGMTHSPRPHVSFLQQFAEPLEMLPPGVASGIQAKITDETPYTLNLMPPEESVGETNGLIDSLFKIESMREKSIEGASVGEKQRLLSAEISKVHALVAAAKHSSFLQSVYGSMVRKPDYEIDLHEPAESKGEIDAAANSVLKVESTVMQSVAASDSALKKQLIAAEVAKIKRIVAGAFH